MNSQAAKAAAGSVSARALRAPGAKAIVYGGSSGFFAVTMLALSTDAHESRHLVGAGEVAGRAGGFGVANALHRGWITEELDGCLEGVKVLRRDKDHVLASVASDMNSFVRPVDLVCNLGKAGLDLGQRQGAHRSE